MATETSAYERLTGGNRKQRKDLQRRLYSGDPGLDVVHANAAGIDIGNESHFVAVPPGRDAEPVREFGSWTADLERMAVWLKSCGIETVAMQSTGVYWFAVYAVLEKHGLKVFLVNASHTKNLPGRKSDVQESQWLMKLHTYRSRRHLHGPRPIPDPPNTTAAADPCVACGSRPSVAHRQTFASPLPVLLCGCRTRRSARPAIHSQTLQRGRACPGEPEQLATKSWNAAAEVRLLFGPQRAPEWGRP